MHRLIPLFTFFLLLQSCLGDGTQYVPDDFQPYVDEFFEAARARGHDIYLEDYTLSIVYRELQSNSLDGRLGECSWTGQRQIRIDPDYWARAAEAERRLLMFHELGHCILLRPHRSFQDDRGQCFSIMNAGREVRCERNINDDRWWNYLVDELFDPTLTTEGLWLDLDVPYTPPPEAALVVWTEQDSAFSHNFGIDGFPAEILDNENFAIRLTANFNEARPIVTTGIGDLSFNYCECVYGSIQIYRRRSGDLFSANQTFSEPVTLEIQRRGEEIHFYVNERFFYTASWDQVGEQPLPRASYRNSSLYAGSPDLRLEILTWP